MSIKIFACGDIVNTTANQNFVNGELKSTIQQADISIGNFEAPIKTNSQPIPKAGPNISQSKESIKYLKEVGFNVCSLANNHIYDFGERGLHATIEEIKNVNLEYIGAGLNFKSAYQERIFDIQNTKIGLIAACESEFGCLNEDESRGGYAWLNHYLIEDKVRELKKTVDIIILIAHAGIEEIDIPLPEWRDKYKRFCDLGVDIIIGHHPHVPQGFEKYKESYIFYSLGNFYFDTSSFENKEDDSYSVLIEINNNKIQNIEILYTKKINNTVTIVNKNKVNFSLDKLNEMLLENVYTKNINKIAVELYQKRYINYYQGAVCLVDNKNIILGIIKYLVKRLILRNTNKQDKGLLLLHNIRIDSHRYIVQRALSLLYEK
jgi:poly-gamma-glutamate synthesis protein (capsule biosynthesis protein)